MKDAKDTPNFTFRIRGLASAILFSTVLAASVQAGPGIQYWQAPAKAAVEPAAAEPSVPSGVICAGSEMVPVTMMKPALPNGRGALVAVQTGTTRVCRLCPVSTLTVAPTSPNHRGPPTIVETTARGGAHSCTSGCVFSAKS